MRANISALEDITSALYRRRAEKGAIFDNRGMDLTGWKTRLAEGLKAKGKSKREVSLASGNGPGYVHSLLSEGKDPTIANLAKVCEAADLSLMHVLFGVEMDRQTQAIVAALGTSPSLRKSSLLNLLEIEDAEGHEPSGAAAASASGR